MTGFLGKLPTVGDFITRNLQDAIGNAWMDRTDAAFTYGIRQDGAEWYERCQDLQPLCFALAPGALGNTGWLGLLRPSLDSFGRSYPVTVLTPLPLDMSVLAAPSRMRRWFAKTDIAVLAAMEGSLTIDRLSTVLEGVGALPEQDDDRRSSAPLLFKDEAVQGWVSPLGTEDGAWRLAWYEVLLTEILAETGAPTLWWTLPHGDLLGRVALLRGMPGPKGFHELLKGEWKRCEDDTGAASSIDAASSSAASV